MPRHEREEDSLTSFRNDLIAKKFEKGEEEENVLILENLNFRGGILRKLSREWKEKEGVGGRNGVQFNPARLRCHTTYITNLPYGTFVP